MPINYRLLLQYDGTDFHGWQVQENLRTVQGELTRVLSLLDDRVVTVHGSGRTDAGVHAEGQVANVNLGRNIAPNKLRNALNGNLPADVRALFVDVAPEDFHARYSARSKTYVYRVIHGSVASPFWVRYASQESRPLDLKQMRAAASLFMGEHDWTAFSAAQADVDSRVRTVYQCDVAHAWDRRGKTHLISIVIRANGFLRYMARSIAGSLLAVGRNEIDPPAIRFALSSGERMPAAETAPSKGLTLKSVSYG